MSNNYSIGIMQGRLSSKIGQPLQSFPVNEWREEFSRAQKLGFNQIEWLMDGFNDHLNPIVNSNGRKLIRELSIKNNIQINSLCAHKFINGALLSHHSSKAAVIELKKVLSYASKASIEYVIIPLMESMSISNNFLAQEKLNNIFHDVIEDDSPIILLESDMQAHELKSFISEVSLNQIKVLYDIGNANAMGFNIEEDLHILKNMICEIHFKDRFSIGGESTRLGKGDTPIKLVSETLSKLPWYGAVVLETPTLNDWAKEAEINFKYTKKYLN
jgi:L-ribulose-5-phosphate 3-epimerase